MELLPPPLPSKMAIVLPPNYIFVNNDQKVTDIGSDTTYK
jgi:hypothetical protein